MGFEPSNWVKKRVFFEAGTQTEISEQDQDRNEQNLLSPKSYWRKIPEENKEVINFAIDDILKQPLRSQKSPESGKKTTIDSIKYSFDLKFECLEQSREENKNRIVQLSEDGDDEVIYRLGPRKMAKVGVIQKDNKLCFHLRECYTVKDTDGSFKYVPLKKGYNIDFEEWCKLYESINHIH